MWQKFVGLKETITKNNQEFNGLKEIIDNRSWNQELYKKNEAVVESVRLGEGGVHQDTIKLDKYEDGVVRATFVRSGEIVTYAEFDSEQGNKIFEKYKKIQSSIEESKQFLNETKEDVQKNGTSRFWAIEKQTPSQTQPNAPSAEEKPVEQKPTAPKNIDASTQTTNDLDYKKALGTLKEFMADKTLDSKEMPDLKTLTDGEKQTEYTTIAKHHQKLAEEALEKGDDKAFEKHSAIANLAGIINKKIENNSLADGELTKLTDKLLNKIDEKQTSLELSIDDIIKKLKPDHGEKKLLPYMVPLEELKNPRRLDYKADHILLPEGTKIDKIEDFVKNAPKLSESERELTNKLLANAKNTVEVPQTKVDQALAVGKGAER